MKSVYTICVILLFLSFRPAKAQEYVTGLVRNQVVADAQKQNRHLFKSYSSQVDTVSLPFFDDFASSTIFPDQRLWIDSFAYINSQYPVNPPSIGVATLDALDQTGAIYSNAAFTSFKADKLTSRFINLNFSPDSNIYLSFFYQAKGLGHMPKATDSLLVQFFAPMQNKWNTVWGIPGDSLRPFRQIMIPIKDTAYLHSAFQFRFMNYASLSKSLSQDPGIVGDNSDWNLDYVYLNKGRNSADTILNDLAILSPLPSLLSYFESIPVSHFENAVFELMASGKTSVYYHLYDSNPAANPAVFRNLIIKSLYTDYIDRPDSTTDNIPSGTTVLAEPYFEQLGSIGNDSALFNVTFYLSYEGLDRGPQYRWNDTVRRIQVFKDYYAYDDGTAENGYGISGLNADNAKLAYQFYCYKPDSLRAVDMYFNDVYKNANERYFDLTVWDSNNGIPGNILFSESDTSLYPVFQNRNHFIRYVLRHPIAIQDTFYVGWIQTTTAYLNLGLDVNEVNNSKMFYNANGDWLNSSVKGSLMIRPVFGKPIITGLAFKNISPGIKLFPNPASDFVSIEIENPQNSRINLSFYDLSAKLIFSSATYGEPVNISGLSAGLYIVRIDLGQASPVYGKLRVIR